ncbi:unnamed protein product [Chironomus riparius]|uniref:Uncharacterized protein n=1 Tax=Chironomus riparius TaxID=315576 RepID=A0A9N9S2D4_9DIPT|nr:unnamed protein product [Chironomus riparius]
MYFLKSIVLNLLLVALTCSGQVSSSMESSITSESLTSSAIEEISSSGSGTNEGSISTVEASQPLSPPSLETLNESQTVGETSSNVIDETSSSNVVDETSSPNVVDETSSLISQTSAESILAPSSEVSLSSSQQSSEAQTSPDSQSIGSESPSEISVSSESPSISSTELESPTGSQSSSESAVIASSEPGSQNIPSTEASSELIQKESSAEYESRESIESLISSESSSDASSIELSSPTEPSEEVSSVESSESSVDCFIPDCRWCDHLELETCECFRVAVDCFIGSVLSEDGCTCLPIPGWNSSASEESTTEPEVSETELSSSPCFPVECPRKMFWNQATCSCECLKKKMCRNNLEFNPATCECERMTTTTPPVNTTTPFVCSLPSCRWCDLLDEENCVCHKTYLDCAPGFELSSDRCECVKPESSESSQIVPSESSSTCAIPPCRPCDILDVDNCVCHRQILECSEGFELTDERCGCIKSVSTSEKCPGLECPRGTFIDEKRCECINEECKSAEPCRKNLIMDKKSCECFCNLSPWQCKYPQVFDRKNCKCSNKNHHEEEDEDEDPENCDYECVQKERCHKNFIFDYNKCECVCDSRKSTKKCPEGTKFDKSACECVECFDFDDPQCSCDCDEILDCPGDQIFNYIGCKCECPKIYCEKGFEMDKRSCECVWKGYGNQYKYGGRSKHSLKGGY